MNVQQLVGQRVREIRELNELTQEQLGNQLEPLLGKGWSRQAVSNAEQGNRAFTAVELVAIAHVLGVSVSRLFAPPIALREVEMPGGAVLDRQALMDVTLPRVTVEKATSEMGETVRTLARAVGEVARLDGQRQEFNLVALRAVELLLQQTASGSAGTAATGTCSPRSTSPVTTLPASYER